MSATAHADEGLPGFGRQTLLTAADILQDRQTHAVFDRMILGFALEGTEAAIGVSKRNRANSLAEFAIKHPAHLTPDGGLLSESIVEAAIALLPPLDELRPGTEIHRLTTAFVHALAQDGFSIDKGCLRRSLPPGVDLVAADDEVHALLDRLNLTTAKGHLEQAIQAHTQGSWAAANGQIRTFLQSLFDDTAILLDPARAAIASPGHQRRILLTSLDPPFISRDLHEWQDNGGGFVNGLFARLNTQGSHPGLSDDDDSTFRLHIALLTARLYLRRLAARVGRP